MLAYSVLVRRNHAPVQLAAVQQARPLVCAAYFAPLSPGLWLLQSRTSSLHAVLVLVHQPNASRAAGTGRSVVATGFS